MMLSSIFKNPRRIKRGKQTNYTKFLSISKQLLIMKKKLKFLIIYLFISLLYFSWHTFTVQFEYTNLYFMFMILIIGLPLFIFRKSISNFIKHISMNNFYTYLLLGYGMVLLEEIFAALFNHLNEGFSLTLFIVRILQFWAFNIFAFTGLIVGIYLFSRYLKFSKIELIFIVGLWGLFAEKTYTLIFANIIAFMVWAPIMITVYGIIMTPAINSIKHEGKINLPIIKYIIIFLGIFLLSIIPILILSYLRLNFPFIFPPVNFIPI